MPRKGTLSDSRLIGEAAWKRLKRIQPDWSVDKLLTYPSIAIKVCKATREEMHRELTDPQILGALINERKRGRTQNNVRHFKPRK